MPRSGKSTYFGTSTLRHARRLRKEMTGVERKLWQYLRRNNLNNVRFRKQVPIGNYIVDFLSYDPRLIIELDGGQHMDHQIYDKKRDEWLNQQGFYVLRFWNHQLIDDFDSVLMVIQEKIYELHKANI